MAEWWETYEDRSPINYPRRDSGPTRRVALTTDPVMERARNGQLRLRLANRHPHEAVRIFTTKVGCAKA